MRNLKRALSLALAAIMLVGMMVVGASAVSYNDFSDREEIVNKDAVSMLVTLGVIDGKPDGSFAPTEGVDRAQMAKMISVIMNQGVDNGALYENSPSGLTDIATSWAKGHINFCYTTGIIAGRGNGKFDPSAGVTGSEAAKMLLVAAGYDPAIEGLTGADWEINTNALASKLGIFRNFKAPVGDPLTRDNAALLIYNALDVEMIESYTNNGYPIAFSDSRTILSYMYGVYKVEGVVVGNEWAQLEQTDSDAALRTGKTTLDNVKLYGSTTANTTKGENYEEIKGTVSFDVTTPVDMMGKTVTMYIEKTTILSNSKVLGVGTKDDINVINATTSTEDTVKDYLKGTGVAVGNETEYYVNYGWCEDGADEAVAIINEHANRDLGKTNKYFNGNGISVEVIDNDNDGTAEYVLYTMETLSEVNRYNDKSETVTFYVPERDNKGDLTGEVDTVTRDFEDVVFVDEVTSDDLILYVEYGGRTYISLPEIVTGLMTRVDRDRDNELYITVEGETYKQSYIPDAASMTDVDLTHFNIDEARSDDMVGFNTEYDFILDSTGEYIVAVRPATEKTVNYALVLGSAWTQNALDKSGQVKIMKADGTVDTYTINWGKSDDAFDKVVEIKGQKQYTAKDNQKHDIADLTSEGKLELYLGSRDVWTETNEFDVNSAEGSVITYTLSNDDVLTIESVLQGNTWKEAGSLEIANDATAKTTAGVGDNGCIVYLNGTNDKSLQYAVGKDGVADKYGYENGDGNIWVNGADTKANDTVDKNYAVDRNTVAFYYDGTNYGVATGWDNMSDVAAGTRAQLYPVLQKTTDRKYTATTLAGVILFQAAPTTDSSDYMLVLDANAATKDTWELTVVFEDGTVKAIVVDDDDLGTFNPENDNHFMQAWTYSENADGTYKVGKMGTDKGTAVLLKNGTIDFSQGGITTSHSYLALSGKANVWDVTDVEKATDSTTIGKFGKTAVNTVLIIENGAIRTAWTWDIPQTTDPGENVDTKYTFDALEAVRGANGKVDFTVATCDDIAAWNLGDTVITYTVSKDGGASKTFTQKLSGDFAFSTLADKMDIPGYSINAGSTGEYTVKVLVKFHGTAADTNIYSISGECTFVID